MATPESTRGAAHESTIITICDYNTKNPLATRESTREPTPEPTQKEIKVNKDKEKKDTRSSGVPDERFQPFVEFAHKEFTRVFNSKIDFNQTDGKALKEMLKRRPELTLTELEERFGRLLASRDSWDQQQALGHPVRFLANNVNRFMTSGQPEKSRDERLAEIERNVSKGGKDDASRICAGPGRTVDTLDA